MTRLHARDRVLLRLPSWLGDFVATEPVVRCLHAHFVALGRPEQLSLAAPAPLLALFEERFEGARRLVITKNTEGQGWRGHDWALLFNGALRSAWAAWRAGIPRRIGSSKGCRAPLLSLAVQPAREHGGTPLGLGRPGGWPRPLPRPYSGVCIEMASLLGLEIARQRPLLIPTEAARWSARRRLARAGVGAKSPLVLVNVGAREDSSKAWRDDSWAALVEQLALRSRLPIFLSCGPGEEARVEAVLRRVTQPGVQPLLEPVAELQELLALCSLAHAVVCTDGGVRHVARATGAPTVVLFGPTDPRHSANHNGRERHLRVLVECGPCHLEVCPLVGPRAHACMREISIEAVVEAALERIEEGARVRALR